MNTFRSPLEIYNLSRAQDTVAKKIVSNIDGIVEQTILTRAVVLDVKRNIELDEVANIQRPQYSVKARIIGERNSENTPIDKIKFLHFDYWYAPLLSIHNMAIPEIGEEVLIIRESTRRTTKGYWISRVNNTSVLNSYLPKENIIKNYKNSNVPFNKADITGVGFDILAYREQFSEIMPSRTERRYTLPVFLGDIIQQGRTNTFIRHSFNPRNKMGVLELGIAKKGNIYKTENFDKYASVGITSTKTIHLQKGLLSDIGKITKATNYETKLLGPFPDGSYQESRTSIVEKEKNLMINIANEIYNISNGENSEPIAYRSVLGEKLSTFQEEILGNISLLIKSIEQMNNITNEIIEMFLKHTHVLPEINIAIPEKEVEVSQLIRSPSRLVSAGEKQVTIKGSSFTTTIQTQGGLKDVRRTVPDRVVTVKNPPRLIPGSVRKVTQKKTIKFDKITIGGEGNKRITTSPQTTQAIGSINNNMEKVLRDFQKYNDEIVVLTKRTKEFLSRHNFLN